MSELEFPSELREFIDSKIDDFTSRCKAFDCTTDRQEIDKFHKESIEARKLYDRVFSDISNDVRDCCWERYFITKYSVLRRNLMDLYVTEYIVDIGFLERGEREILVKRIREAREFLVFQWDDGYEILEPVCDRGIIFLEIKRDGILKSNSLTEYLAWDLSPKCKDIIGEIVAQMGKLALKSVEPTKQERRKVAKIFSEQSDFIDFCMLEQKLYIAHSAFSDKVPDISEKIRKVLSPLSINIDNFTFEITASGEDILVKRKSSKSNRPFALELEKIVQQITSSWRYVGTGDRILLPLINMQVQYLKLVTKDGEIVIDFRREIFTPEDYDPSRECDPFKCLFEYRQQRVPIFDSYQLEAIPHKSNISFGYNYQIQGGSTSTHYFDFAQSVTRNLLIVSEDKDMFKYLVLGRNTKMVDKSFEMGTRTKYPLRPAKVLNMLFDYMKAYIKYHGCIATKKGKPLSEEAVLSQWDEIIGSVEIIPNDLPNWYYIGGLISPLEDEVERVI